MQTKGVCWSRPWLTPTLGSGQKQLWLTQTALRGQYKHYEDDWLLFTHHFDELSQQDTIKDSVEDLDCLEDRLRSAVRGMSASSGYTADQMVVAIAEKSLSSELIRQWRQYIHDLLH